MGVWMRALLHAAGQGLRIERALAAPQAIARAVIAVSTAALIGYLLHDPLAGAMLSVGAFLTSVGTLLVGKRHRFTIAGMHGGCLAAGAAIGAVVHSWVWLFLLVLFVGGFIAGWLRVFGIPPSIRSCLVLISLMITADLAPTTAMGLRMSGYIAAGAGMVVIAQLVPPYGPRWAHQRRSVAAVYDALATAAEGNADAVHTATEPIPLAVLTEARRSLDLLPTPLRPAAAPLFGLLGEAERLLRSVGSVGGSPPFVDGSECEPRARWVAAADVLTAIADTTRTGRRVASSDGVWAQLAGHDAAHRAASGAETVAAGADAAPTVLADRLREAERLAVAATNSRLPDETVPYAGRMDLHARPGALTRDPHLLRAELVVQAGLSPAAGAWARGADTVAGAVLAMLLYVMWPTWYTRRLPQQLARWLELQGQRFAGILTAASGDPDVDHAALDALRHRSREAREAFETAARNAEEEPVRHRSPWPPGQLSRVLGAVHELARQAPLLTDKLSEGGAVPAAARLAEMLQRSMNDLARVALGGAPLRSRALRAEWQPCADQLRESTNPADRRVVPALEHTIDAIEHLAATLTSHRDDGGHHGRDSTSRDD